VARRDISECSPWTFKKGCCRGDSGDTNHNTAKVVVIKKGNPSQVSKSGETTVDGFAPGKFSGKTPQIYTNLAFDGKRSTHYLKKVTYKTAELACARMCDVLNGYAAPTSAPPSAPTDTLRDTENTANALTYQFSEINLITEDTGISKFNGTLFLPTDRDTENKANALTYQFGENNLIREGTGIGFRFEDMMPLSIDNTANEISKGRFVVTDASKSAPRPEPVCLGFELHRFGRKKANKYKCELHTDKINKVTRASKSCKRATCGMPAKGSNGCSVAVSLADQKSQSKNPK